MADSTNVIKSIGYNQHAIIRDILDLHCDGGSVDCDVTYSVGNFYGHFKVKDDDGNVREFDIEQPRIKLDVDPQVEGVEKLDPWGPWPLEDNSLKTIMFDPPFVIGPRDCASMHNNNPGSNRIGKRFSSYYPVAELLSSYLHHLREAFRVLEDGGKIIVKCQNTTTGGKELHSSAWIWFCASALGFEVLDKFTLCSKVRLISGKVKKQQHARKYESYFYVLKKGNKNNIRYFDFMTDEEVEELLDGLKKSWRSPKKRTQKITDRVEVREESADEV